MAEGSSIEQSGPTYDVAVVGLGPVGALLGNLLGLMGLDVAIFEREAGLLPIPRAVGFDDEIMRIFQTIGIAESLLPILKPGTGGQYVAPSGEIVIRRPVADVDGPQSWRPRYNFHQPHLELKIREGLARYPNVRVQLRHEVFALDEISDGVLLRVEDMANGVLKRVRARFVVGCDGARSLVRRLIDTRMNDLGLHELWVVADFMLKRDPGLPQISTQFCHPVTPVTFVHVIGDRRRMEFKLAPNADSANAAAAANVWALASRWLTPEDATLERAALYTFHSLIAQQWRRDRLIIAGDSAHQTPPFLGQGLCAGFRDAANVAWKLLQIVRHGAPLGILESYASERIPHAVAFVDGAVKIGGLLKSKDAEEMRRRAADIGGKENSLHNPTPSLGEGLNCDTPFAGKLSAQPRFPDGQRMDEITGYGFAFVALNELLQALSKQSCESLQRLEVRVVRAEGAVADWLKSLPASGVLLRPDRYIFADVSAPQNLEHALQRLREILGFGSNA